VSWKLGFSTSQGNLEFSLDKNLGFPIGTKLGVSNRLGCDDGTSSDIYLEIADFVDVVEDDTDLRWGRM
jgi:hypothetical protein